ncbi:MAG: TolC family protein [Muribaculaceae bacterium]|jgi:outer membrane protein TolC
MNRAYLAVAVAALSYGMMDAGDIDPVLQEIERNNLELKALRSENRASVLDMKGENSLEAPSVEYSPFFRNGVSGVASSELVVSQEFDFPTLYAARNKSVKLQQEALDYEYQAARRNVLLTAKQKCFDLVMLDHMRGVLDERMANADELLVMYEKKFAEGGATSIELNRIKMERMDLQAELLQNETLRKKTVQELSLLNGEQPLSVGSLYYPEIKAVESIEALRKEIVDNDAGVHAAEASVALSQQEIRVNKQGWIPKLSVGYRRNTDMSEASNGFLVGASFPVFSNRNKVKASRAKHAAAQLNLDNTRLQVESEAEQQLQELQRLHKAIGIYDLDLLRQSLLLLKKAVMAGSMSLVDYYTEADRIYQKWQTYLTLENQYHNLWATLNRNSL